MPTSGDVNSEMATCQEEKPENKLPVIQAALKDLTRRYGVSHPVDFMITTLFQNAGITPDAPPAQCLLEGCEIRGGEFCTVFMDISIEAVRELMMWLNENVPNMAAKSLEACAVEDRHVSLSDISVYHCANMTLHIESLIVHALPLMTDSLVQKDQQRLQRDSMETLTAIIVTLEKQQKNSKANLQPLNQMLADLGEHIRLYGFGKETAELNAQMQNIVNEQQVVLPVKKSFPLFETAREKLSGKITDVLLMICKLARVKIMVDKPTTAPSPAGGRGLG